MISLVKYVTRKFKIFFKMPEDIIDFPLKKGIERSLLIKVMFFQRERNSAVITPLEFLMHVMEKESFTLYPRGSFS